MTFVSFQPKKAKTKLLYILYNNEYIMKNKVKIASQQSDAKGYRLIKKYIDSILSEDYTLTKSKSDVEVFDFILTYGDVIILIEYKDRKKDYCSLIFESKKMLSTGRKMQLLGANDVWYVNSTPTDFYIFSLKQINQSSNVTTINKITPVGHLHKYKDTILHTQAYLPINTTISRYVKEVKNVYYIPLTMDISKNRQKQTLINKEKETIELW